MAFEPSRYLSLRAVRNSLKAQSDALNLFLTKVYAVNGIASQKHVPEAGVRRLVAKLAEEADLLREKF